MQQQIRLLGYLNLLHETGTRWMMMPFRLDDARGTVPEPWSKTIADLVALHPAGSAHRGVAYLTVDDALVAAGETHRRPGLHCDGAGGWGGGGGWGCSGMIVTATHLGAVAWDQELEGHGTDGNCEHLRDRLDYSKRVAMHGGRVYWLAATCVHEALPMLRDTRRTFVRISMPSNAPWYEGYTPSPFGVQPTGPILRARAEEMAFRP